jgi:hypothetical protein
MALVIGVQGSRGRYIWRFPGTEAELRAAWSRGEAPAHVSKGWEGPQPTFAGELETIAKMPGDLDILVELGNLKEAVLYIGDDSLPWPRRASAPADDDDDDDDDEGVADDDSEEENGAPPPPKKRAPARKKK